MRLVSLQASLLGIRPREAREHPPRSETRRTGLLEMLARAVEIGASGIPELSTHDYPSVMAVAM